MSKYVLMVATCVVGLLSKEKAMASCTTAQSSAVVEESSQTLDLSHQCGRNASVFLEKVIRALNNNDSFIGLNLSSNKLDDDAFMNISTALRGNTTLQILNLNYNNLRFQGLIAIKDLLMSHPTLHIVSVKRNQFSYNDLITFFEAPYAKSHLIFQSDDSLLLEAAEEGCTAHPYGFVQKTIGELYEKGGRAQTPEEWKHHYIRAKFFYENAKRNGCLEATSDLDRVTHKIKSLSRICGYFFEKILTLKEQYHKPITPTFFNFFTPSHPFFEEVILIDKLVSGYSPRLKEDVILFINEISDFTESWRTKTALKILRSLVESKIFHDYAKQLDQQDQFGREGHQTESSQKADETIKLFFEKLRNCSSKQDYKALHQEFEGYEKFPLVLHSSLQFSYFFGKIRDYKPEITFYNEDEMPTYQNILFTQDHPLFNKISHFAENLSSLAPGVQEAGIYLTQKLLDFKQGSVLADAVLDYLIFLTDSVEFQKKAVPPSDLYAQNTAEHLIRSLGHAIEYTTKPNRLIKLSEVPSLSSLKVTESFISDPRIVIHNCLFRKDDEPFERQEFIDSVQYLLNSFQEAFTRGDITLEMCYNGECQVHGNYDSLRDLLTNTKDAQPDFSNVNPHNQFANRLIKIASVFKNGTLDQRTMETQLASWAAAGWQCTVRSEQETEEFYKRYLKETINIPRGDNSLEMSVALMLADLRYHLFKKLLPLNEIEPLHQERYLKRKLFKELGLEGYENNFEDPHQKVVNPFYINKPAQLFINCIRKGNEGVAKYYYTTDKKSKRSYSVPIPAGQGYNNPQTLIDYVCNVINDFAENKNNRAKEFGSIFSDRILYYNRKNPDAATDPAEYYDEDTGRMTEQGVTALLYSLGYLEKNE